MARKILNRKELREENDTAEREAAPSRRRREEAARKTQNPQQGGQRSAAKGLLGRLQPIPTPHLAFRVQPRAEADKKAAALRESQKSPHFVQLVKEVIEE